MQQLYREIKVAMIKIKRPKVSVTPNNEKSSTWYFIVTAMVDNSPEDATALPNAVPPIANITMFHG